MAPGRVARPRLSRATVAVALAVAGLLVIGLVLRLIGIGYGDPFVYHPDEWIVAKPGMLMAQYNGWDPHQFFYPSALMYAMKGIAVAVHGITGVPYAAPILYGFDTLAFRGYYEAIPAQFPFFLAGRLFVALIGTATIPVSFVAARAVAGAAAGLVAATFVALVPLAVTHGHYLTTDVPSAFVIAVVLAIAIRGPDDRRALLVAGLVAGFAASTKYNAGAVIVVPLLLAATTQRSLPERAKLGAGIGVLFVVGFVALSPAILLETRQVIDQLGVTATTYSGPGPGFVGNAAYWIGYLWSVALRPGFTAAAALGIVLAIARPERRLSAVLAFVGLYFVLVSLPTVRFDRNLLPLIPPLAVLAGVGVARAFALVPRSRTPKVAVGAALMLLVGVATFEAFSGALTNDLRLLKPDTRTLALQWIDANVPPGARIAREIYTPQPSPGTYSVGVAGYLADHPLDWYRSQNVDFLVASDYVYPRAPAAKAAFYAELFALPIAADIRPGPDTAASPRIVIVDLRSR